MRGRLGHAGLLAPRPASHDDLVPVTSNANVTRTVEEDHRARMFVYRSLVRNFFYVDIEDGASGKIDSLGVHHVAFEENFYPTAIFGHAEYDAGGISHKIDDFLVTLLILTHKARS
jgi:hypothetical protein